MPKVMFHMPRKVSDGSLPIEDERMQEIVHEHEGPANRFRMAGDDERARIDFRCASNNYGKLFCFRKSGECMLQAADSAHQLAGSVDLPGEFINEPMLGFNRPPRDPRKWCELGYKDEIKAAVLFIEAGEQEKDMGCFKTAYNHAFIAAKAFKKNRLTNGTKSFRLDERAGWISAYDAAEHLGDVDKMEKVEKEFAAAGFARNEQIRDKTRNNRRQVKDWK